MPGQLPLLLAQTPPAVQRYSSLGLVPSPTIPPNSTVYSGPMNEPPVFSSPTPKRVTFGGGNQRPAAGQMFPRGG